MAKALLIAEKPSLMKEVQSVYKKHRDKFKDEIDFISFRGHTLTLKMPGEINPEWDKWRLDNLPMIPDNLDYKVDSSKKSVYNDIKKQIKEGGYDYLINCCDAGREGQAIFHSVYRHLKCKLPVKRIWLLDLTEDKILEAFLDLRDDLNEKPLVYMTEASLLRAKFDWLIGMNYSPAYTLRAHAKKGIGLGRVMTPTLAIIVDRDLEIKNFTPKDFYQIEADFNGYSGMYFREVEGKEVDRLDTQEEVDNILKSLSFNADDSKIISVDKKKNLKYAPALHNLSNIQREASRAFGYTPKKTLEIVQSLYEKKLLSYPRTNSEYLTTSIAKDFDKMLKCIGCLDGLGDYVKAVLAEPSRLKAVANNKKYVDNSKVTDHYAITPTGANPDLSKLSTEEGNIYTLVAKRFLSIFMNPQATEKTVVITENNTNKFKTNGTILLDHGYTVLYNTNSTDKVLPPLSTGDTTTLLKTSTLSKKTSPPSRHTDDSLLESMVNVAKLIDDEELKNVMKEAKGIGTDATRADIVEKLIKNGYMTRKGRGKTKHIEATEYGISIINGLRGQDIISPMLAAEWESKLSNIEACEYEPKDFEREMKEYIKITTEEMKKMNVNIEGANGSRKFAEELDITCPKCGKYKLIENGKAFGCSSYKNEADKCGFTIWKESTYNPGIVITKNELDALVRGEEVLGGVKLDENFKVVYPKSSATKAVGTCPVCGKEMLENSKAFGCSGYKDKSCSFTIWKNSNGVELTKEDAQALLSGQTVKGAKLENGKLVYAPKAAVGKCPKCGKDIAENSKAFGCVGYKDDSCNFAIWKEIAGAKITEADVKALLNGESTKSKTFKKKNGSGTFNAVLVLEDGKVSFKF